MPHSIDFHAARIPAMMHLMQGMYLPIIVDPKNGWGTTADKEFILVQSEFYTKADASDSSKPVAATAAAGRKQASDVVFNGRAIQYKDTPIKVADAQRGAVGMIQVGVPKQFATISH